MTEAMPDIPIVAFAVVTWNNEDIIDLCLDSILAQEGVNPLIYVLDNDSHDGTIERLRRRSDIRLTASPENTGYAKGNNLLIGQILRESDAQWIALVNSDATLDPRWATTLVAFGDGRANLAAMQGLTMDYFNHDIVDSCHIFVSTRLQGIQFGYGTTVEPGSCYPRKVFGVNAAAAVFARSFIERQPDPDCLLFDERFYMYYEDIDVAYRALIAGYDSYFVPDALAYHMGSVSAKKKAKTYSARMVARNQLAMIIKNTPCRVMLRLLPAFLLGVRTFLGQVRLDFGAAGVREVVLSYGRGLVLIPRYARSRRAIQKRARLSADYLVAIMNADGVRG
ncbi:MAG: glycosyltransferase family 2 protein [Propionibacteriaceae bacterium]|jgi:GT2 family glycosyltransferase|nr:glycosyltransferase family 2 protein [Propionibacteriaceae bacterium]